MPGSPRWAGRYRSLIRRQCRFLTRLTLKSLFLLFLGCLLSCVLVGVSPSPSRAPPSVSSVSSVSSPSPGSTGALASALLSALASLFIGLVALAGLLIAIRKSLRLERVRRSLLRLAKGAYGELYAQYAAADPAHGLQFEEFNRLAADASAGRMQFSLLDLGIIFNALDEHQKSAINEREFTQWLTGTMTYL
ncbi:hypothetical protein, conserved [Eimeria brunetti]|uniref:EF-hand domain-containing protein n=1 Tax=Eimeria brunetti TaxID=51314 RepID=U6LSL5_9EIME|nr:hypothetical protein, conserved [Eimeria brunetti]